MIMSVKRSEVIEVKRYPSSDLSSTESNPRKRCYCYYFIPYIIVLAVLVIYFPWQMCQLQENVEKEELNIENNDDRRLFVREMARGAWKAYARHAWGQDALEPVTDSANQQYLGPNGGLTIFQSLSTLYLMDLNTEYQRARNWIVNDFKFSTINQPVNVFIVVTEIIGSLLSNYALTGDKLFLSKAHQIARMLAPAYGTETGLPYKKYNPYTKMAQINEILLSEAGGQFLEYRYLANVTGDREIGRRIDLITDHLQQIYKPDGLYFSSLNSTSGQWTNERSSLYSPGSAFYSYLIKAFIQSGSRHYSALKPYIDAVTSIERNKLIRSSGKETYVHDYHYSSPSFKGEIDEYMRHDSCYLGAMFGLGAYAQYNSGNYNNPRNLGGYNYDGFLKQRALHYLSIGKNITEACHITSIMSRSGLPPRYIFFREISPMPNMTYNRFYLTSELAESYFVLWRMTHDPKYREYAWQLVQSLWRYTRVPENGGYSNIEDVDQIPTIKTNFQPPEFLGATLKYLYLTFSDINTLSLDQWVFNRAGQPLPICAHNLMFPAQNCR